MAPIQSSTRDVMHFSRNALLVFCLSLAFTTALNIYHILDRLRLEELTMRHLMVEKSDSIRQVISKLLYKTQALSALVIQNDGNIEDFERVAATIVDDPAILNILIAPNGAISKVYPMAGNERAIGFSLMGDQPGNREASRAIESRQLVFGGPFVPVQGGTVLVGRLPVYVQDGNGEDTFWGLVSVTLKYPDALAGAHLNSLDVHGFAYEIWRVNPDDGKRQIIAHTPGYNPNARFIEQPLTILNAEWHFRILPVRQWHEYPESWIFLTIGLGISLLLGFFVQNNHDLTQVKCGLEKSVRTDSLTGLLNRSGLFQELDRLIRAGRHFRLCYMDLNGFKQINDTYGHHIGDFILLQFCVKITKLIDEHYLFARIAGDEFVLVRTDEGSPEEWWARVDREFASPVHLSSGVDVPLSFSWGVVSFPKDGATIDKLIVAADKQMYNQKNAKYALSRGRRARD